MNSLIKIESINDINILEVSNKVSTDLTGSGFNFIIINSINTLKVNNF